MAELEPVSPIGFDGGRLAGRVRTGTETYAFELLTSLAPLAQPGEVRVYLNSNDRADVVPEGLETVSMPAPRFWTHGRLSWEMARRPPGLLFVPSHVIPAMHPRSVVTIHDLAYLTHPEAFSKRERGELDMATRWNARVATKVIAVSRRTKLDLIEHYGVDPEKIVVIHHGVSGRFQPADLHEIERVRKTYLLERDYVLCVGTIHPRKNYPRVISAFEQAIEAGLEADLVICGDAGSRSATTLEAIDSSTVRESIRYLRYADFGDLPALYSGSSLVMLASLYEGFGMPALEAMACGAPVVASTSGALPEVAGSAARLVDPLDVGSISDAMVEICASTETRNRLSILGQRWARRFTWERSAGLTMSVLRAVRDGKAINDEQLGWSDMVAAPPQSLSKDGDT